MSTTQSVLVVEDDKAFSSEISRGLRSHGFDVDVAETPKDAAHLLRTKQFHLILLDLVLRDGEEGFEVFELLRATKTVIPVIIISNYVRQYVSDLANFYLPVTMIINKPCSVATVVMHVAATLAASQGRRQ